VSYLRSMPMSVPPLSPKYLYSMEHLCLLCSIRLTYTQHEVLSQHNASLTRIRAGTSIRKQLGMPEERRSSIMSEALRVIQPAATGCDRQRKTYIVGLRGVGEVPAYIV